ncbi:DUF3054 domain-containing protein [uncultured Kocuria sp.]|uniref:DUF3054 domain-containing protein n=1 Tax=uncultured Kocuria sp. TaxID=259305 RepID=UPI0026202BE6|nr:DUF3054 domain-containing protein [uncultured Kocuria sp.]
MHTSAPATALPEQRTAGSGPWAAALTVDVLLVLLFAGLGRKTHALDAAGILSTAWPFLAGLLLGWLVWRVHRNPFAVWPRGVALWVTTVAVGMGLRLTVGEGTAPSFVLVTLAVLGAFLLGPRALVLALRAARSRRPG